MCERETDPCQEVVFWGKFDSVKERAEAWIMVEQQQTKEMEWPTISLTVSGTRKGKSNEQKVNTYKQELDTFLMEFYSFTLILLLRAANSLTPQACIPGNVLGQHGIEAVKEVGSSHV